MSKSGASGGKLMKISMVGLNIYSMVSAMNFWLNLPLCCSYHDNTAGYSFAVTALVFTCLTGIEILLTVERPPTICFYLFTCLYSIFAELALNNELSYGTSVAKFETYFCIFFYGIVTLLFGLFFGDFNETLCKCEEENCWGFLLKFFSFLLYIVAIALKGWILFICVYFIKFKFPATLYYQPITAIYGDDPNETPSNGGYWWNVHFQNCTLISDLNSPSSKYQSYVGGTVTQYCGQDEFKVCCSWSGPGNNS